MGKIIGIDLGTTNSAVAIYENDQAKIYENSTGKRTTPSVVALRTTKDKKTKQVIGQEWIVGDNAKNQSAANPLSTLYGVKRLIGRRFDDPEVAKMAELASYKIVKAPNGDAWVEVDGKAMAPAEISAKILRELKEAVEKQIGEEITEAVITVPAYFNDAQRKATRDAGAIAGLEVKRIINEPTAAALAYGMDKKKGGKIAVFDLGGGTFDVSILEVTVDEEDGSLIKVLSTNGDTFLGGENFDEKITEYVVNKLNEEHGTDIDTKDPASKSKYATQIQRIRAEAEKVKIALSLQEMAKIDLPFLLQDGGGEMINFELDMTRAQLETLVREFVDRTIGPCKKALADAGLKASDLDEVILVGGQTRMPAVVETVKKFFGKEPRRDVNPDEIVAMGASVQGAILHGHVQDVLLLDVIPLSIGLRAANDVMSVMIPRNTSIPTEVKDVFSTSADRQPNVAIKIYQGERAKASDNKFLGEFVLDGILPLPAGKPQIEVAFNIDADGVLVVTAKDLLLNKEQKMTIKTNGGLSEEEVARMLKDAEVNAEKDRVFKEAQSAKINAEQEIKDAATDQEQDYFKSAPEELQTAFRDTMTELTKAYTGSDIPGMLEKTAKLRDIKTAIGEAFLKAAQPQAPEAENDAPEGDATPGPAVKDTPKGPAAP